MSYIELPLTPFGGMSDLERVDNLIIKLISPDCQQSVLVLPNESYRLQSNGVLYTLTFDNVNPIVQLTIDNIFTGSTVGHGSKRFRKDVFNRRRDKCLHNVSNVRVNP